MASRNGGEFMRSEIKEMLDKTCELFNIIDEKTGIMEKAGANGQLCNILKYELTAFLMCLSAADGRISRVEAKLLRDYFEIEFYPIHIKETIKENGIGSKEYYKKVPECLRLAVKFDNYMVKHDHKVEKGISEIVLELFRVLGKEMVIADEKVTMEEQLAWGKYITLMTQYIVDKSKLYQQKPDAVARPGTPIEVDYEMSLDKIGRIYTIYVGRFSDIGDCH